MPRGYGELMPNDPYTTAWGFDQAPDVAAVTSRHVLEGAPILLVIHYSEDDSWAFLDGGTFDVANGRVVVMEGAVRMDPSLREIANLPPGWVARRPSIGASWTREQDPDV